MRGEGGEYVTNEGVYGEVGMRGEGTCMVRRACMTRGVDGKGTFIANGACLMKGGMRSKGEDAW